MKTKTYIVKTLETIALKETDNPISIGSLMYCYRENSIVYIYTPMRGITLTINEARKLLKYESVRPTFPIIDIKDIQFLNLLRDD